MIRRTMNISKYTEGLGQEAKELPPNWRCFTEAEVERIVSRVINDKNINKKENTIEREVTH
jgi:hypothetical protein